MRISIAELEARAARGWRAPQEERRGGWLLRAAEGFTGRANSALAIGDPGLPLAAAVAEVGDWYRARGLPPMIAVPFPVTGPEGPLDRLLEHLGWPLRQPLAAVMTARPQAIAGRGASLVPVTIAAAPDDDWLAMYHYRGGSSLPPIGRRLLMSAPWQAFASVREAGQTLAIGRVAGDEAWAGLTAIETHRGYRRRGLASAVSAALATVAADHGAAGLYLQVERGNSAARGLYGGIGFRDHHHYHYRAEPGPAS